ncbi:MAG TPA: hypothetical protein VMX17_12990 [Candidatus Glassbacteria bacterium]|nr:hypothetical protein [Candidatus Glassbacteria bacterium]
MSDLNQIEEIEKLYAKPKTYKIPKNPVEGQKQAEIKIKPLGLKDMGLMNVKDDSPIDEISKNVKSLWAVSLEITEEQAEKISLEFMKELMDSFMDANNFKEEDMKKTGIKDFIKKKQEQLKANEKQKSD